MAGPRGARDFGRAIAALAYTPLVLNHHYSPYAIHVDFREWGSPERNAETTAIHSAGQWLNSETSEDRGGRCVYGLQRVGKFEEWTEGVTQRER